MKIQTEKWTVVKGGTGKFSPRYSNNSVAPYWPFGESGQLTEFDTLEEAIDCLMSTKCRIEHKRLESEEKIVFDADCEI